MTGETYHGLNGQSYATSSRIGIGGEGAVFDVSGNPGIVVKIYNEALEKEKSNKLLFMARMASDELLKFAAWPIDVVNDRQGRTCGIVMKKLVGYVPLHNLFSPMDRKKIFPDKGYNFLIHVAINLAIAFFKIHQLGIVIGDVNEANLLVRADGLVSFIDCDSFQIKSQNRYYFCEVGVPRYTPPELLVRGTFNEVVRTENNDSFSLATLIFQLLFLGRTPFTGVNPNQQEIDEETAIKSFEFAYSLKRKTKKLFPAKNSLDLNSMTPGIQALFHRAFEHSENRPTPVEWVKELKDMSSQVVQCSSTKAHYFLKTMSKCPWCEFKQSGILYFLDDSYLKGALTITDINQFINGFKIDKIIITPLKENYLRPALKAQKIDSVFYKLKYQDLLIMTLFFAVAILTSFVISFFALPIGLIAALVFRKFSPAKKKLNSELARRKLEFDQLNSKFKVIVSNHNSPKDFNTFNITSSKLLKDIDLFKSLPTEVTIGKRKIEEKHYSFHYNHFLTQFDIRYYPISTFGTAKKQTLYQNGIRTAADFHRLHKIKIAGIGPRNIQVLLDWQRQVGSGFIYKPDLQKLNADLKILNDNIAAKGQQIKLTIQNEYKTYSYLKASIESIVGNCEKVYNQIVPQLYQAELDFKHFENFLKPISLN